MDKFKQCLEADLRKRQLLPGKNIKIEKTSDGWKINANFSNKTDAIESYNGYFAATNTSDEDNQKVKITSGYASVNGNSFEVKDDELTDGEITFAAELTITAEAYIFLQAVYDTGSGTISAPTIEQSATFPPQGANVFRGPIAHIKWNGTDSVIKSIFQIHYGMMYGIITGTC